MSDLSSDVKDAFLYASVDEALEVWTPWPWRYFHPQRDPRMACAGSGSILIVPAFLERMDQLRADVGRPLIVNSWYRSPAYNAQVSSTGLTGPHTSGRAVDLKIMGGLVLDLVRAAIRLGFTGIGWRQHGSHPSRFLHLDDLEPSAAGPRPWAWTYP